MDVITQEIEATNTLTTRHDVGVPLTISLLADRPDLAEAMWNMPNSWPEFMRHDPIGGLFYGNVETRFAEFVLVAQDDAGEVVACAYSIPFVLGDGAAARQRLGLRDPQRPAGQPPRPASPTRSRRSRSPSAPTAKAPASPPQMLVAMRDNAARRGFAELLAPVRPNGKTDVHEPMSTYALRVRDDGLPVDPWLRVHVRAGGRIDEGGPALDGHPRHARGVAGVDGAAVRPRPARSWCPGHSPRCTATSNTGSRPTSSPTCGSCTAPGYDV